MDAACHLTPIQGKKKKKSFGNAPVVYVTGGFFFIFHTVWQLEQGWLELADRKRGSGNRC